MAWSCTGSHQFLDNLIVSLFLCPFKLLIRPWSPTSFQKLSHNVNVFFEGSHLQWVLMAIRVAARICTGLEQLLDNLNMTSSRSFLQWAAAAELATVIGGKLAVGIGTGT